RVGGAISKKVMGGSKSLTGALTVPRKGGMTLARGLGTVGKGAGIAAAAGLLAGVVGDALDKKIRGAKEEIVPGVSGVRGGTVEGAGLAGGLKGAAKGAAMGMVFGPVGAALGGLGGFIMGKIGEELAQAEFNAFVEMQENLKGANEQLGRFAKLNEISTTAMINLNSAVAKPLQSFDKIQAASFAKAQGGLGISNVLGRGGIAQRIGGKIGLGSSGGIGGAVSSTAGGALAGAALGAAVGSVVPVIGTLAGAIVGGLGGALTGLVTALFTADKTIENTALSFDRAAQSITPEFIENLNKAVDQASGSLIDKLDMSQVKEIAAIETTSQNLNPSEQASLTTSAFKQMNTVLNGSTGETSRFVKELNKLTATKIEVGLIDGIRAEADLLGDEGGKELKAAFVNLRSELDIDELVKTGDMSKAKAAIQNSGLDDEHKKMVEKIILSQMEEINAKKVAAAQQKVIEDAAKRSRKALDALVAGLERFGERTQGIAVQMGLVADQMKTAFAQITGEKTIGEFKQFNPFENLASASDQQIDSSIGQLKAFGGNTPEADAAFRDTSGMLKAGRDFPLAMRNVVDKLDAAQAGGAKLTNQEVIDAVQLEFGGSLPPEMLKSLTAALEEGRATSRQGGSAFTFDTLKEMFEEGGNVSDLLGKAFNATKEEMAGFDKSVAEMKNALMDIARIQEQMAKRRMEVELSMLDKQEAIRDRVNSALGNTAGAFQRAQGDLQKRMTIQMRGGLKPGEGTAFTGNVLDPAALFGRLETLDQKREKLQGVQGQGTPEEVRKNSEELGKLNREINGTEAALRQLSNDTRMLAAIEAKIAEQQARQKDFGGTVTSIIDGLDKLERGEMSVQDFNQQITAPLSAVEKMFDSDQDLNRQEGADLMRRIQSNDPLIMGQIRRKTEDIARQRGVDTSDAG
ncbi:MAG TPA: hypothetical protein DF712_07350, partial [Balneola sp.]|nr:hypothetical protein [Balneola sp.]